CHCSGTYRGIEIKADLSILMVFWKTDIYFMFSLFFLKFFLNFIAVKPILFIYAVACFYKEP
ncbi:unnamed protein product, partial [Candidula unifasciata]